MSCLIDLLQQTRGRILRRLGQEISQIADALLVGGMSERRYRFEELDAASIHAIQRDSEELLTLSEKIE